MAMIKNIIFTTCLLLLLLLPLASCTKKKQVMIFHFPFVFLLWISLWTLMWKIFLGFWQIYLVEFGEHSSNNGDKTLSEIENTHHSYLLSVKQTEEEAKASLLYSYKHSINGFAALLTPKEVDKLSGKLDNSPTVSLLLVDAGYLYHFSVPYYIP